MPYGYSSTLVEWVLAHRKSGEKNGRILSSDLQNISKNGWNEINLKKNYYLSKSIHFAAKKELLAQAQNISDTADIGKVLKNFPEEQRSLLQAAIQSGELESDNVLTAIE